ncbi:MAG: hypothetical protein ABH882_05050 [Candidatus Omnitrophota bacterium]|nr:ATP-binding protein [Candidatus Omnitrophota bacterium]MBU1928464.1 ATP-binding protein [Candidatus Omnitrophota bacterium]MBU2221234.1 ATP-binding protein [Candidatus Omnitrophota bacterium]
MFDKKSNKVRLKIAGVTVEIKSAFYHEAFHKGEENPWFKQFFSNFVSRENVKSDIKIDVKVENFLPKLSGAIDVFKVIHPQDRTENWQVLKKNGFYIYKTVAKDKEQVTYFNKAFDRARVYVLPKKDKGLVWNVADLTYDFLQVLFINYFAQRKSGIFLHGAGIRDSNGKGLVFMGRSGAGKTTLARTWHEHSRAEVLNDDHVIVRKVKGRFFIYGSPWCGEFRGFQNSYIGRAELDKLFFIYQYTNNTVKAISSAEAFKLLYPNIFPNFWDRKLTENIIFLGLDLVKNMPCLSLGLIKSKSIIPFVRSI